jgi:hypothetical protein
MDAGTTYISLWELAENGGEFYVDRLVYSTDPDDSINTQTYRDINPVYMSSEYEVLIDTFINKIRYGKLYWA